MCFKESSESTSNIPSDNPPAFKPPFRSLFRFFSWILEELPDNKLEDWGFLDKQSCLDLVITLPLFLITVPDTLNFEPNLVIDRELLDVVGLRLLSDEARFGKKVLDMDLEAFGRDVPVEEIIL